MAKTIDTTNKAPGPGEAPAPVETIVQARKPASAGPQAKQKQANVTRKPAIAPAPGQVARGVAAMAGSALATESRAVAVAPPAAVAAIAAPPITQTQTRRSLLLQGYVDTASAGRIEGWVWAPDEPQRRIRIDAFVGETRVARGVADRLRVDLQQAGIGDGRHGYLIPLPSEVLRAPDAVVDLRCAESGAPIPGSPLRIGRTGMRVETRDDGRPGRGRQSDPGDRAAAAAGVPIADAAEAGWIWTEDPEGGDGAATDDPAAATDSYIDFADWTGISGWIWNPHQPDRRFMLELLDGDVVLVTMRADQYRADLEETGIGDGRYGFSIPFSETLLPYARHVLHLRVVGSQAELPSFPLVLTRDHHGLDHTAQFVLSNIVAEAQRAATADQLSPIVSVLIEGLDAVAARYAELTGNSERRSFKSLQENYPPLDLPAAAKPAVSIVIPVFNKFALTYNCIKSLIEQGAEVTFEVILVDDCSRDETMLAALVFGSGVKVIRNTVNQGFIRSCNAGFDAAAGDFVVFLNNDTIVKERWLDELYATFENDPRVGVAGAKLLYADGSLQESGGIVWRLGDAWNWGRGQSADDPRFCYLRDTDYVSGAVLMMRSAVFAALGKFDEHFMPMYYEDTDLCFRARQAGYRVVVQPASQVIHLEGGSAGTSLTGQGMKRYQAVNHRKFFDRWKDLLTTHRFNGELPELEVERGVRRRALFIDDSVPEPDKDAGSNAALQHMLSLQRVGYKVTFIPADNMACIEPYTTDLQRRGIECLYHPYQVSVEDACRRRPTAFDLVYLHRYSNAAKYAGMLRMQFPKARLLYSIADLHFLRTEREAELRDDPELRKKAAELKRLELTAMQLVDCVIVHSDVEAGLLRAIDPDIEVEVIPWTVPLRPIARDKTRSQSIAMVGGFGHPPNVDAAIWAVQSIMPQLRKELPGVELLLAGSKMPPEVASLAADDIVPLGYVPSLDTVFERVRATVAPLRFGAGLKGKVLESMAAGIPCVMTSVAAEGIRLPKELAPLVADEPEALARQIAALCHDDRRYRRLVEACKAHVTANYSPERIDELIRKACRLEERQPATSP